MHQSSTPHNNTNSSNSVYQGVLAAMYGLYFLIIFLKNQPGN